MASVTTVVAPEGRKPGRGLSPLSPHPAIKMNAAQHTVPRIFRGFLAVCSPRMNANIDDQYLFGILNTQGERLGIEIIETRMVPDANIPDRFPLSRFT